MTAYAEGTFQNLLSILPAWVKEEASCDKCLVQFFVSFFDMNNANTIVELCRSYEKFCLIFPVFLRVVELRELKLILPKSEFAKPRNGVLHVIQKLEERKVEPGVYAILGAPYASNNSPHKTTESDARTALSSFSAMISMLYGFACLHSKTCEFLIDIQNGSYSFFSPIIENPTFFRLDHVKEIPVAATFQFSTLVADAPTKTKDVIAVALTYLDRALREKNHGIRLSLYLSSIEVLVGNTSTNALCKLLKISHGDLRDMGYDDLYQKRNGFVHEGRPVQLHREEERFIQYLIVDLICGKLGGTRSTYAKDYQTELKKLAAAEQTSG
jgi:hypothetical protein